MEKGEPKRLCAGIWEGLNLPCPQPGVLLRSSPYGRKKNNQKSFNWGVDGSAVECLAAYSGAGFRQQHFGGCY